jgi:transposase
VAFLQAVENWLPGEVERIYAIADNLSSHRATDVLLFMLARPRWEMVFQPKSAASLNLIEPWWKVLRSFALAGRRFESWDEVIETVPDRPLHIKDPRRINCCSFEIRNGGSWLPRHQANQSVTWTSDEQQN